MNSGNLLSQSGYKWQSQIYYDMEETGTGFVEHFFGITLGEKEVKKFSDFSRFMQFREAGLPNPTAAKKAGVPHSTVEKWLYGNSIPFAVRLHRHYQKLGKPKEGYKWLSINSTRGGLFTGLWVSVPKKVNGFEKITEVLNQLTELETTGIKNEKFNFPLVKENKAILFAYLLGMIIGDSSKHPIKRKNRITRRIQVRLTTAHKTSERIGEFTSLWSEPLV